MTPDSMRIRPGRRREATRSEGGFALAWFGVVLIALMAMAGSAVDLWDWWYNGNQQQSAADAAALGGVPFLPGDPAAAKATALDIATANGVPASQLLIETSGDDPTLEANQMRVTVTRRVDTRFLKLVGVDFADVERDSVAEYTSRLPMGSPEQYLGRDPETGDNPGFWLSVSSRGDTKVGGDRYQNLGCGGNFVYNCTGGNSTEYSQNGYAFSVELTGPPTGDLVLEAYDPVHLDAGAQDCTNTSYLPDNNGGGSYSTNLPFIVLRYPLDALLAPARYSPGDQIYCSGDVDNSNNSDATANVTTFIVREPDNTQSDDYDNPAYSGAAVNTTAFDNGACTRQFRGIARNAFGGGNRTIYQVLAGNAGGTLAQNNAAANAAQAVYRRWVTLCRIPLATVQSWYNSGQRSIILQVRSNADLGTPFTASAANRGGRNHFALRAGYGSGTGVGPVSIYAQGRLPIHNAAVGNSETQFYVTRVPPGNAGRTLALDFYDVADAGGTVDFEIVPPIGFGGAFSDCTFKRFEGNNGGANNDVGLGGATASGCKLSGMTNNNYNGRLTEVRVRVPTGYSCVLSDPDDCWIQVRVTYNAGAGTVFDHTVWDAGVVGEPVRLIE